MVSDPFRTGTPTVRPPSVVYDVVPSLPSNAVQRAVERLHNNWDQNVPCGKGLFELSGFPGVKGVHNQPPARLRVHMLFNDSLPPLRRPAPLTTKHVQRQGAFEGLGGRDSHTQETLWFCLAPTKPLLSDVIINDAGIGPSDAAEVTATTTTTQRSFCLRLPLGPNPQPQPPKTVLGGIEDVEGGDA
ncbi:hypothetical protein BDN72DRAFT_904867 [Pluteus cervinus]|uniref:Uncharacterized protein n=1 Tax=Pluteus cervinus TaxID=181527 RepID=A0ACD3A4A0_9AGAR|nr:hypothetical protein BDN72DRAFT_904867 [Pluteus cervinus]